MFKWQSLLTSFRFNYGPMYCCIEGEEIAEDLLILAYNLYLRRYFYICDDRQTGPMQELLASIFASPSDIESWDYPLLHESVQVEIFRTMHEKEKDAVIQLFSGISPLVLTSDMSRIRAPRFTYGLEVLGDSNSLTSNFRLSIGPDKILLPLTVTLFFQYAVQRLSTEGLNRLVAMTRDLISYYASHDCRKKKALRIEVSGIF